MEYSSKHILNCMIFFFTSGNIVSENQNTCPFTGLWIGCRSQTFDPQAEHLRFDSCLDTMMGRWNMKKIFF